MLRKSPVTVFQFIVVISPHQGIYCSPWNMNIPFRSHSYCDTSKHLPDGIHKSFSISKDAKIIYKTKDIQEVDRRLKSDLVVYRRISKRTPTSNTNQSQQRDRVFKVFRTNYKTTR